MEEEKEEQGEEEEAEEEEQEVGEDGLYCLGAMSSWNGFGEVLSDTNLQRLLAIFPETIPSAPLTGKVLALHGFLGSIADDIVDNFPLYNQILAFLLKYTTQPVNSITELENYTNILESVVVYLSSLHPDNAFEKDYTETINWFLVLQGSLRNSEWSQFAEQRAYCYVVMYSIIWAILKNDDNDKCYTIRRKIMAGFADSLKILKYNATYEVLEMIFSCCWQVIQDDEEMIEEFLDNDKFLKLFLLFWSKLDRSNISEAFHIFEVFQNCPRKAVQVFLKFNFMKPLLFAIKVAHGDEESAFHVPLLLQHLEALLQEAESLVDDNNWLYNPLAIQLVEKSGLKVLEKIDHPVAKQTKEKYFGTAWDNYLARKRGLTTKKAI